MNNRTNKRRICGMYHARNTRLAAEGQTYEADDGPSAKASAYLNATREQFVANVARAKQRLNGAESGALAGPIAIRLDDSVMILLSDYSVLAEFARKRTAAMRLDARACRYIYQEWLSCNAVITLDVAERSLITRLGLL